jgi:hypothetical protein
MKLMILPMLALIGAAPPPPRWEALFDGRTLSGWTVKITGQKLGDDPLNTFVVRDGVIRVSYAGYKSFDKRFGYLFWRAPLSAYRLRFEYRLYGETLPGVEGWQHSNSGLMFHSQAPATMTLNQEFPVSLEYQLLGVPRDPAEPTGNLCTPGTTVAIAGKRDLPHCVLSTSPTIPLGRWVRAEVEVLPDGRITHLIDGKPVLRYSAAELDPADKDARPLVTAAGGALTLNRGYIALQSEGHPIEFRRIELQRIR